MARLTNPGLVELDSGLRSALGIGPTTWEPFTEEELEIGWEHHRERLMAQEAERPFLPGSRPWGWWYFEAGREPHLAPYPSSVFHSEGTDEEYLGALREYQFEPVLWLAEHGHLRDDEVAALAEKANEARIRIDAGGGRIAGGPGGGVPVDRWAIELYETVREALKG